MGITMNDYREAGVHTASETQGRPQSASAGSSVRPLSDAPSSSASPSTPAPTPVPGPVISQALSDAGLTDNTRNRQIVSSLIAQELPIDAETLKSVARALSSYPNESPDAVILLRSAGVEITPASLEDANAFLAARDMLLDSLGDISSYVEGAGILSEADAYAAPSDHPAAAPASANAAGTSPSSAESASLPGTGTTAEGFPPGSALPSDGSSAQSQPLSPVSSSEAVYRPVNTGIAPGATEANSQIPSDNSTQTSTGQTSSVSSAQNSTGQTSDAASSQNSTGQASDSGSIQKSTGQAFDTASTQNSTGQTYNTASAQNSTGQTSDTASAQTTSSQVSSGGSTQSIPSHITDSGSAHSSVSQTTAPASNAPAFSGVSGQSSATVAGGQQVPVNTVQSHAGTPGQTAPEENSQISSDQSAAMSTSQTTTEHPASRPLSELSFKELVSVLSVKPGIEPSDISSEGIKRFLESAVTYLENAREVSHRRGDEAMAAKVDKAMNSMRTMLKLNDMYAYAEVPVKNEDEGKKTHLRFFANKKPRIRKDEGSSAVLHLNMPSLKELDIRMVLRGNSLRVDFFSSKDASSLLEAESGTLSERLSAIGIDPTMDFHERTKESSSDNSILQQATQNPTIPLQGIRGFDTRA